MAEHAIERLPSSVSGLREEVKNYFAKWQGARASAQRIAKENEKRIEGVIETVETVGVAFAVSWYNGKNGKAAGQSAQIMGYDAELVVGAALVGLGLFELAGKYDEHLYAMGAGALAAWATKQGWASGGKARPENQPHPATTATAGVAPAGHYVAGVAPAGSYQAG
jgi:hypothetical protein